MNIFGTTGQQRRAWLDRQGQNALDAIQYYAGPGLNVNALAQLADMFNPVSDIGRAGTSFQGATAPGVAPLDRLGYLGATATDMASVLAPVAGAAYADDAARGLTEGLANLTMPADDMAARFAADEAGNVPLRAPFDMGGGASGLREPTLMDALNARAAQMELPIDKRIQPRPDYYSLDRDYFTPAPSDTFEDLSLRYPRNPDPSAPLPKGDRARVLVDQKDAIAQRLAERIRATGQMDADTRYFYHSDGPIYRAARAAGLSEQEAEQYLRDLGNYVAATSPRTKVEENLRNATLAMAKTEQGIPFRDVVGPGSGGISEKGYPMMTGKGGIHGILLDDVINSGTMNVATNPKPSNFGPNIAGNRSGVTVDTHAIRGTLQTLNEMQPGAVPEGFILPKFRDAYRANPEVLTPDMIDDTLASQMVGPKGATTSMQTEYPVFADIWHGAADRLGVSPAEAQSMGWFGFGDQTNLGSARKTPVDIFDERLNVTAQALGVTPEVAARNVFRRQIPLLGVGGLGIALGSEEQRMAEIEAMLAEYGL